MIRYIHGSEDSLDVDVYYVFDEKPSFDECRRFCSEDPNENRNIIVIKDGVVVDCFIGTVDEINNGLIDTYPLHAQNDELLVNKRLERDITIKSIRAVRGILSILSRTQYRSDIKYALTHGWQARLDCLLNIDFTTINYNELGKRMNGPDMLKVIAFQIGQTLGLFDGVELYTKSSVAKQYPELKSFLYREPSDLKVLNEYRDILSGYLDKIKTKDLNDYTVLFCDENRIIDLKHEKTINPQNLDINNIEERM